MTKTITVTVTPNYDAMFEQFKKDAMNHLARMSRTNGQMLTRKEVYDFIASFRIALCSMNTVEQIIALRTEFDTGAEKMFAVLMREQEQENES